MPATRPHSRLVPAIALFALVLAACGDRSGKVLDEPVFPPPATQPDVTTIATTVAPPEQFELVAPWVDGSTIPDRHTCTGDGVSPALFWSGVPSGTVELALTVVDNDAAGFVHWIVYAISPIETGTVEGEPPAASFQWPNSGGTPDWVPPCPPESETHRYEFTLHALNQQLEAADDASAADVLSILNATTIARSTVVGLTTGTP